MLVSLSASAQTNWPGNYEFYETSSPEQLWGYNLTIAQDGQCSLTVSGKLSTIDLTCKTLAADEDTLKIYVLKENDFCEPCHFDTKLPLFSLYYQNKWLITEWGQIHGHKQNDSKPGHYFEKQ